MSDPYKYRHDDETYETPEAFQHVQDMTRFGLHSKSDIACELAGRDRCIAELERERDEANKTIEALEVKAHDLRLVLDGVAKERNELREQVRWRKWPDEKPTESDFPVLIRSKAAIKVAASYHPESADLPAVMGDDKERFSDERIENVILPMLRELITACSSRFDQSRFYMSIPARPDRDADLILSDVFVLIESLRKQVAEANEQVEALRAELRDKQDTYWQQNRQICAALDVDRHGWDYDDDGNLTGRHKMPNGPWVLYQDILNALEEVVKIDRLSEAERERDEANEQIEALQAARDEATSGADIRFHEIKTLRAERDEAKAQLAEANKTIEALREQVRWRRWPDEKPQGDTMNQYVITSGDSSMVAFYSPQNGDPDFPWCSHGQYWSAKIWNRWRPLDPTTGTDTQDSGESE